MMYEHLQKWGPRKQEVKFFLRHEDSPTESSDQGVCVCYRLDVFSPCGKWRVGFVFQEIPDSGSGSLLSFSRGVSQSDFFQKV